MTLSVLGQRVRIDCAEAALNQLVLANFGAMALGESGPGPDLRYCLERDRRGRAYSLICEGQETRIASNLADLLFLLEKDLVTELQRRRPDLVFLHAAAVEWQGKVCVLAADSGHGKSMTTWALLHHGFSYLSDELSPIDVDGMNVHAYPHAVCLKQRPPHPYTLPAGSIDLGRTIHVPVHAMPSEAFCEARSLGALILLRHDPLLEAPTLQAISTAEASARLYLTVLNALAHPNRGLDATLRIAERVPCFALCAAELSMTSALIRKALGDKVTQGSRVEG